MTSACAPSPIGITTSIPLEVPLAAGRTVCDLNNRLMSADDPGSLVRLAETDGFPRTCCAWIRGLYGVIRSRQIREVVFVTGGDCSNTTALLELATRQLERVHLFAYPYPQLRDRLEAEIDGFCTRLGTTRDAAEREHERLRPLRRQLAEIDRANWESGTVDGATAGRLLLSASDLGGDPERFAAEVAAELAAARTRPPRVPRLRLALLGVPPIFTDLHQVLDRFEAGVVFNEIPRQFAMTEPGPTIVDTYLHFTYPYGVWPRIADIRAEVGRRRVDGVIHYTQSFCHRQIHDLAIRAEIPLPILTLEGDQPGPIDPRTRLRIESFLEVLADRQAAGVRW